MHITIPVIPKIVIDWDFHFVNGVPLQVTVDAEMGDTVQHLYQEPDRIVRFHIAARMVPGDIETRIPARDLTVHLSHVIAYETHTREIMPLTPEQELELAQFYRPLTPENRVIREGEYQTR